MPLKKLPKLPPFTGYQCFPRSLPITSCVHFVLISKLPPRCPTTTSCIHLASIFPVPLSNFLHSVGFISGSTVASQSHPHLCLSTASRIHAVSISQLPLVSPQLLACTVIWVQYLDFRFSSQQLLAFILVSMSNFPLSHLPLSHQFSAGTWLQYLHVPPFL